MDAVRFEARTQCKGCGQPVPFNAFVNQVTCATCSRTVPFDDDDWQSMMEKPFKIAHEMPEGQTKSITQISSGTTTVIDYTHEHASCGKCKGALPDEVAQFAGRGWCICPACGNRLSIRAVPPSLQWSGAMMLIGEDTAQLTGQPEQAAVAQQAVMLQCPQCRAPLSVDGSQRMIKCQYCSVDVYLPDDLWQRLHPVKQVGRWYAVLGAPVDRAAAQLAGFKWYSIESAVFDPHMNLFIGGEDDDSNKKCVFCLGPDLKVRWVQGDLDMDGDIRAALDVQQGRLVAWSTNKHSAILLSAVDGSKLGTIGGKEPDNAQRHHLDMDACKYLVGDLDGTFIGLMGDRLLRYDAGGHGIPTWPPRAGVFGAKAERLESLYTAGRSRRSVEDVSVEDVGNSPTVLDDYAHICVGWDGRFYAEYNEWIACFDRTGKLVYKLKLNIDDVDGDQLGADQLGHLFVRGHLSGDPQNRVVVRVAPDGSRADVIAQDRRRGGVVGEEDLLAVAPNGTLVLLRYNMRIRVLGPDGRLLFQSDKSREDDADEDKEAARRE